MTRRDITIDVKARILYQCSDPDTGRFLHNGLKNVMAMFPEVSRATICKIKKKGQELPNHVIHALNLRGNRVGNCGRHSKLTDPLRAEYVRIVQEYANAWVRLTDRMLQQNLGRWDSV